jgi:hypothetical protein
MQAMPAITRDSLMTLETYARSRKDFRARVLEHKKHRKVQIGANLTLIFASRRSSRKRASRAS